MDNYSIRLNLLKLRSAFVTNIKGKTATKPCVVIPIDENPGIYVGDKGCYLNLNAYENNNASQYGDSHGIRQDIPKDLRECMTEEERRAYPFVGNMRPILPQPMSINTTTPLGEGSDYDALPF